MPRRPRPIALDRAALARGRAIRTGIALVLAVAAGAGIFARLGLAAGILTGWTVFAATRAFQMLWITWPMDAAMTRSHSTAEDPGRRIARIIGVFGSVASLGAVALVLIQTRHAGEWESGGLATIAVLSVAASWTLIQVDYMLRYARIYYDEPAGGISFNQDEPPRYSDFAYFSVGLGMTYQVADTNVQTNEIRRLVIGQTMLAYLFGAIILGTVINLVSNLAG